MTDLFSRGTAWHRDHMMAHAARPITLSDPHTGRSWQIRAVPGSTQWDEDGGEGVVARTETRDWIVAAQELDDALGEVRPLRGWIATDSMDGTRYQLHAPGDEPPWQYSDTGHHLIRIHTLSLDARQ